MMGHKLNKMISGTQLSQEKVNFHADVLKEGWIFIGGCLHDIGDGNGSLPCMVVWGKAHSN